jgi:hypothetical protein
VSRWFDIGIRVADVFVISDGMLLSPITVARAKGTYPMSKNSKVEAEQAKNPAAQEITVDPAELAKVAGGWGQLLQATPSTDGDNKAAPADGSWKR